MTAAFHFSPVAWLKVAFSAEQSCRSCPHLQRLCCEASRLCCKQVTARPPTLNAFCPDFLFLWRDQTFAPDFAPLIGDMTVIASGSLKKVEKIWRESENYDMARLNEVKKKKKSLLASLRAAAKKTKKKNNPEISSGCRLSWGEDVPVWQSELIDSDMRQCSEISSGWNKLAASLK